MSPSFKDQTWAVTGATGLMGNNLIRMLLERGARVRVLVRGTGRKELAGLAVEETLGDLHDQVALKRCFEGADVVVHAAAMVWIGYSQGDESARINIEGTRNVCDALPPGARLLHISTVDALGWRPFESPADENTTRRPEERGVPYGDTKEAADQVVRDADLDHVILRPAFMVGPWDWKPSSGKMVLQVAQGRGALAPDGSNNIVDVRDVCRAIMNAATLATTGSEWILGNKNITYIDLWRLIAKVTGGPAPKGVLPKWAGRLVVKALKAKTRLGLPEGTLNAATARYGFREHCFDSSKARDGLDLPQSPIEDAIADAWAWFQANGYA